MSHRGLSASISSLVLVCLGTMPLAAQQNGAFPLTDHFSSAPTAQQAAYSSASSHLGGSAGSCNACDVGTECGTCDDECCGTAGCGSCYTPCGALPVDRSYIWSVSAGAAILHRSDPDAQTIFIDPFTQNEVLNASDFDLGWGAGPRISLVRQSPNSCRDIEFAFLGIDSWNDSRNINANQLRLVNGNPNFLLAGPTFNVSYGSRLYVTEVNLRHHVNGCLAFMVGFLAAELSEEFHIIFGTKGGDLYETSNNMYGFQIGADGKLLQCGDRFSIDGFVKAGILGNNARFDWLAPDLEFVVRENDDNTAFLGQLALTGTYQLSRRWYIEAGYQLLWLEGVALAIEQVDNATVTSAVPLPGSGVATVDTSGSPFYHGALVSLEGRW